MKVRIWGCRGSIPRAHPDMSRYGGNTPCVEVTSSAGSLVVLDLGSGAFDLGLELISRVKKSNLKGEMRGTILITHTHWDHIQGFPFFAPLFAPRFAWNVYGPRGLTGSFEETLSGQMQYEYFPVTLSQLRAQVSYHELLEGAFDVEGIRVKTHYLNHTVLTLGYRLESGGVSVAYITDHEPFDHRMAVEGYQRSLEDEGETDDDRHVNFFSGVDLLLHDCQYTAEEYKQGKTGWGHSTLEYVVDVAISAGAKKLALFHHDPNRTDSQVDELVRLARERAACALKSKEGLVVPEIVAAAEGLLFEFDEQPIDKFTQTEIAERRSKKPADNGSFACSKLFAQRKGRNIDGETIIVGLESTSDLVENLTEDLEKDKLEVEVCEDFDKLLKVSKQRKPSLLVINQSIPGGNALDACANIRKMGDWARDVSFLVVAKSQKEMESGRAESNIIKSDDWITEPCTAAYIRTRVRMSLLRSPCRWKRAPIPSNEEERLAALHESCVLKAENPESLSRIGRIAKQLFNVPVVTFSVLAENEVRFITSEGFENIVSVPRDAAFCAHAIHTRDMLVVNDALNDDRFADNPLVVSDPHIRFYAGMPISVQAKDGIYYPIGSMCLIDRIPRKLDMAQIKTFRDLAAMACIEYVAISRDAQAKKFGHETPPPSILGVE